MFSVIVLKYQKGYVAELRFKDKSKDKNISSTDHNKLLDEVVDYIQKVTL